MAFRGVQGHPAPKAVTRTPKPLKSGYSDPKAVPGFHQSKVCRLVPAWPGVFPESSSRACHVKACCLDARVSICVFTSFPTYFSFSQPLVCLFCLILFVGFFVCCSVGSPAHHIDCKLNLFLAFVFILAIQSSRAMCVYDSVLLLVILAGCVGTTMAEKANKKKITRDM